MAVGGQAGRALKKRCWSLGERIRSSSWPTPTSPPRPAPPPRRGSTTTDRAASRPSASSSRSPSPTASSTCSRPSWRRADGRPAGPPDASGPAGAERPARRSPHSGRGTIKRGARRLLGGEIPAGKGAFYAPTVLAGVEKGMPAFDEETFGPVAAVIRAKDEGDAVRLANDSSSASAPHSGRVTGRGPRDWLAQIEAGVVFVNGLVNSDPRLPFGGIKRSGYGRELSESASASSSTSSQSGWRNS